jgi:hypothetical protein
MALFRQAEAFLDCRRLGIGNIGACLPEAAAQKISFFFNLR